MAQVLNQVGVLQKTERYTLIKKVGMKNDKIARHNHPEAMVLFTVVKGEMAVQINETPFIVSQGEVLSFDGNDFIQADFLQDSEILITLVLK